MNPAPSSYSGLVPEHVDPDSEYSMRRWRLRRSSRAIRFAQQMLREAYGDAVQGNAHARVPIWLDQGMRITERVVERLRKDLRRKHALQLFQWVSWIRGSENLKVLHGEALTLKDAKEGALRDLRQLQDECTEDIPKYRDGVAVVTGPRGGRDRKSTRLNSSHLRESRMPSSA